VNKMVRSHTAKWKHKELADLQGLFAGSNVVAVAELDRFPAGLFARIRKKLAGKATIRVTKTRIAMKALAESKFKDCGIDKHIQGSIGLIFTEMDPFELYLNIKKSKGKTFAKPGMIAEADIIVPEGDTGLPPGPDLTDLKNAGIKVKLQGASIKVAEDCVIVKAGEPVSENAAKALSKLDIKSVEIGLKLTGVVEGNELFEASVLDIDADQFLVDLLNAFNNTLNLSVEIAFPTKQNITILVAKSYRNSKEVAIEAGYLCNATSADILGKVKRQADALNALVDFSKTEAPAEAPKEAPAKAPAEEKPAEEAPATEAPAEEKPAEAPAEIKEEAKEEPKDEPKEKVKEEPAAKEVKEEPVAVEKKE